jgi:L-2-hydroxyglutarate oxidase
MKQPDVIVIGGGIVGLATAYQFNRQFPDQSLLLLEKETSLAQHQTGHNSGVLHSGIYYKPGSLKAVNCRAGKRAMEMFCEEEGVPFSICGKIIVATQESELERLAALCERGQANGVSCEVINRDPLLEMEPHCGGIRAIFVRETGIVDYRRVCARLGELLHQQGQTVRTGARVTGMCEQGGEVVVQSTAGDYAARYVVNCAGLYSDKVAAMSGCRPGVKIVPFRGEYFEVIGPAKQICRNLIYPVPDPRFPFLGVHFTRMISGQVECGPNAVLAFAREGYGKTEVCWGELLETLTYSGFVRMAARYWWMGTGEMWRSLSKRAFVKALQRLVPEIQAEHLTPAPAGIRAQAVAPDGAMVDDFAFSETARIVNVLNAPSPAATASLAIGKSIVERLAKRF